MPQSSSPFGHPVIDRHHDVHVNPNIDRWANS